MDRQTTKNIIEAALMCAGQPLEPNDILRVFEEADRPARKLLDELLAEIGEDFTGRSLELKKVASGFRLQVRSEFSDWLGRLGGQRVPKYSRALMETLALVAYRQPVTRGEIESVRGVSVSSNIVRTLLERGWVRIVGHRDVPGRPAMLGTTKEFLDYFGLTSLDDLPTLSELRDFDSLNVELDFDGRTDDGNFPPEPGNLAALEQADIDRDVESQLEDVVGAPDTEEKMQDEDQESPPTIEEAEAAPGPQTDGTGEASDGRDEREPQDGDSESGDSGAGDAVGASSERHQG